MSKDSIDIKRKFLWHSSAIYCLTFDKTGNFIFTGGDDGLVNIYSISDDKLITTLVDGNENEYKNEIQMFFVNRNNDNIVDENQSKYIEEKFDKFAVYDLALNYENTLIAAGMYSGLIRIWNLQTGQLIARLDRHIFPVVSLKFSPLCIENSSNKYLISTSEEGFTFYWKYDSINNEFESEPEFKKTKYDNYRALSITTAYSSGGLLMAVIHTYEVQMKKPENQFHSAIRVFSFSDDSGPHEVWKSIDIKSHDSCEYSLKFSHKSFRFASGCSKDSNAYIWSYDVGNKKWDQIIVDITNKGDNKVLRVRGKPKSKKAMNLIFVDEIEWSCADSFLITSLTDDSIKVWNSESGLLLKHFENNHTNKIACLGCHPIEDHIFISGGYDGRIFVYDVLNGNIILRFECTFNVNKPEFANNSEDDNKMIALNPSLHTCHFSPNGHFIASTDGFGNLTLFKLESDKVIESTLDQLEQDLARIHADSEEEEEEKDKALVPLMEISELKYTKETIKLKFEREVDLINGIDRQDKIKPLVQNIDKNKTPEKNLINVNESKTETNGCKSETKSHAVKSRTKSNESDSENKTTINRNLDLNKKRIAKFSKERLKAILNSVFENPNSLPFQTIDYLLYPTYRKEINNADLSLSSIREDMMTEGKYSYARFVRDMNEVFENAKEFFEDKDQNIYGMAVELEKFYENEMETIFGNSWKASHKKNIKKENDEEFENELDVSQASTSKINCDNESDINLSTNSNSNSVKIKPNLKQNKAKQIKNRSLTTVRNINVSYNLTESPLKKTRSETQKSFSSLNKSNARNSSAAKKRKKSTPKSSPNKRIRQNSKLLSQNSPPELDLNEKLIENEKTNGDNEKTNGDNESNSSHSSNDSEPKLEIDLELINTSNSDTNALEEDLDYKESLSDMNDENGLKDQSDNESIDNKELPYFCIFCVNTFKSKNEAKNHYITHLCPLKCLKCSQEFATFDDFLKHNSDHSKTCTNVEWSRHYSDSILWIENFLMYQQTKEIHSMERIANQKCVVCNQVFKLRPKSSVKGLITIDHLREHLKYVPNYQCLICFLDSDEYFYCTNSDEAESHLREHHSLDVSEDVFRYYDSSIPKLEGIIQENYSYSRKLAEFDST